MLHPDPTAVGRDLPDDAGPFPVAFTVGTGDVISMGGAERTVPEVFNLTVRLEIDGNPMVKTEGEAVYTLEGVTKGTRGVTAELR